jgi:hypothetical protein
MWGAYFDERTDDTDRKENVSLKSSTIVATHDYRLGHVFLCYCLRPLPSDGRCLKTHYIVTAVQ